MQYILLTFQDEHTVRWSWEEPDDQWYFYVYIGSSYINKWKKCQNSKGCEKTLAINMNIELLFISLRMRWRYSETGLGPKKSMDYCIFSQWF